MPISIHLICRARSFSYLFLPHVQTQSSMENCTAHPWMLQTGCCYYSHMAVSSSSASPVTVSYLTISPAVPNGSAIPFHPQQQARAHLNVKGASHTAWPSTEQDHIESHSNIYTATLCIWHLFGVPASIAKVIYPNPIKVLSCELQ